MIVVPLAVHAMAALVNFSTNVCLSGKSTAKTRRTEKLNIARGTTDPGHSLYNLNNFSDRNQFEGGMTCIGSKFGH